MPRDRERVAECRAWLRRAWVDVGSAAILLRAPERRSESAVFHRQQGEHQEPSPAEAEEALQIARQAYEAVLARLPEEVRP